MKASFLFATKSLAQLQRESDTPGGLHRALGGVELILLGVGVILGTGVFVVTGRAAAANAGPAVALSFAIAGLAAALAALCYAEMGSMLPLAGSAYTYAYATMGEVVAFAIGWDLVLEWCVSGALVAVGWSGYLTAFVASALGVTLPAALGGAPFTIGAQGALEPSGCIVNLPAVAFTVVVMLVAARGIKVSARFNALAVAAKVLAIGLFLFFGARAVRAENLVPFVPPNAGAFGRFGWSGVLQGASMVYLSFIGFDAVSTAAQEAKNPRRDIPLGTLVPVALCTGIYVAVGFVLTGLVPYNELGVPHPLALGVSATGKAWLATAVAGGAVLGLTACMMGAMLAMPRIFMAMGRDGLLPPGLGRVHAQWGTPHVATYVAGATMAVLAGLLPVEVLGELSSIGTMFAFFLVSLGVMILRLRRPDAPRRFRVPGGPFAVPLTSAAVSLLLMGTSTAHTIVRLFLWMAVGLGVYAVYGRRSSRLRAELLGQ